MSSVPTQKAVFATLVNGRNSQDDFLQLATNHGGTVFGWIDAAGILQGTLANSGVGSLNGLTGAITLAAGTNVTLMPSGTTITIGSTPFVYVGTLAGIPATATVGQLAFITDAIPGRNIFEATAPNVFTQQSSGALPIFAEYTLFVSGGVVSALNNSTGVIDYSNADAAIIINSVISNMPNGGTIFFKNGIYNLNSLILETTGGFTNYYAIGIPGGGPNQYSTWNLIGESMTPAIDLFTNPVQTNGVIFNVTPTAISSVAAGSVIMGIWARPDTVNGIGATTSFKNFIVRFPTNQRGNETAIDVTQALMSDYDYITADFNISYNSLAFPVAGTQGLYGITSTQSAKEENYMKNAFAVGYNVGLDIQSEHTVLVNSYGVNCNHGIDYGVRGPKFVYHVSSWVSCGWAECARGLTLGANCKPGSVLNISGLDIEDATSLILPAFQPVYHALETNPGSTSGFIDYSIVIAGVGAIASPPWLFDGGGGTNFMIASGAGWTSAAPFTVTGATTSGPTGNAIQLATDNFTRTAENPLSDGGKWTEQTGSGGTLQTTGTLVEAVTTSTLSFYYWNNITWSNNQYSELTVQTLTGPNFLIPSVRMDTATNSGYMLHVEGTGVVGIVKYTSGTQLGIGTSSSGVTINTGDVFRIIAVGSNIFGYHNGALVASASDSTYASGAAGFGIFAPTLADATSSLWAGGTAQSLTLGATTSTSATAGSNGDVPAQVVGYLNWNLGGVPIKIPFYNV